MDGPAGRRGLVVQDGKGGGDAPFVVENHVCPADYGDAVEAQLEWSLRLPDPVQLVGVLGDVLDDQPAGRLLQLAMGWLVGRGKEELRVQDGLDLGLAWNGSRGLRVGGDRPKNVMDGLAIAKSGGQPGLKPMRERRRRPVHNPGTLQVRCSSVRLGRHPRQRFLSAAA
jgi:hypothetical protein